MTVIPCASWAEFRDHLLAYSRLSRLVRDAFIFRGHRDSEWKLESTLDRRFAYLEPAKRAEKSERLLLEFSRELYGIDGQEMIEAAERLELIGRHHGLPTTVLDWTKSPYVAAYFAFEEDISPRSGLVTVCCYDRRKLSLAAAADRLFIDDMSLVGGNLRALQQRGVFLRLPPGVAGEAALADGLWQYTIPYSERTLALSDLDSMLITAKALFLDRDSAARTAVIRESLP